MSIGAALVQGGFGLLGGMMGMKANPGRYTRHVILDQVDTAREAGERFGFNPLTVLGATCGTVAPSGADPNYMGNAIADAGMILADAWAKRTLWVDLTYSEDTQEGRDAAQMFCYYDVKMFVDRLRSAARRYAKRHKLNIVPYVHFLVAGEQGDQEGRCHWHCILYTNFDVLKIGEFQALRNGKRQIVTDRKDMLTVFGGRRIRLNWSLWPAGFSCLHEVDQGGASYVLSYVNKDQFTAEKSEGPMRESKSENFATGLFRMSKRPGIGENFLMRKFEALDASGSVLPSLNIRIPGLKGYWHPSGLRRKKVLCCLLALNTRARWATGCDAAQWSSLLRRCEDNQPDLDILHGKIDETENPEHPDYECPVGNARKRAAWSAAERPHAHVFDDRCCSMLCVPLGCHRRTARKMGYLPPLRVRGPLRPILA